MCIRDRVGAHREVLSNHNGNGFVPGNSEELYESLKKMLENKERAKIGNYNRKQVEEHYSIEKINEDFRLIILNTLAK